MTINNIIPQTVGLDAIAATTITIGRYCSKMSKVLILFLCFAVVFLLSAAKADGKYIIINCMSLIGLLHMNVAVFL